MVFVHLSQYGSGFRRCRRRIALGPGNSVEFHGITRSIAKGIGETLILLAQLVAEPVHHAKIPRARFDRLRISHAYRSSNDCTVTESKPKTGQIIV